MKQKNFQHTLNFLINETIFFFKFYIELFKIFSIIVIMSIFFENRRFEIALYEPQIPLNLGAIMRTTFVFDVVLHIIHPLGFVFRNKKDLGRSALDYEPVYVEHNSFKDFLQNTTHQRKILFTPHTSLCVSKFVFKESDILVFGREEDGMETENIALMDALVSIPMFVNARSLNLSVSVGMGGILALLSQKFVI